MTTDLLTLLDSMTPTTLVQMHADALESMSPDAVNAIRRQLVALVGEEDADAMLGAPAPAQNDAALAAFMGHIATANEYLDTIRQYLDDNAGLLPEDVHWGHVGDLTEVEEHLRQAAKFIGGGEE